MKKTRPLSGVMPSVKSNMNGGIVTKQNATISTNKLLLLIVILSLAVRGGFYLKVAPWREDVVKDKILIFDAGGYDKLARDMLSTGSFSKFGVFRLPGYPLFVAFFYGVFGTKVWVVLLAQVLADVLTTLVVFSISWLLFESIFISGTAAFLYAVNPLTSCYCMQLLSEIVFAFLFALSVLWFLRLLKSGGVRYAMLSGLALAGATYVRPVTQFFIAIPVLCVLAGEGRFTKKILNAAIIAVLFAGLLGIWQYRNYRYYGHWQLSNVGGVAIFDGASQVKVAYEKKSLEQASQEMLFGKEIPASQKLQTKAANLADAREELMWAARSGMDLFAEANVWQEIGLTYIKAHHKESLKLLSRKMVPFFFSNGESNLKEVFGKYGGIFNTMFAGITGLEYVFAAIGLLLILLRKGQRIYLLFFVLLLIYFPAITGLLIYSRYRIPMVPFYLVLSAFGMVECFGRLKVFSRHLDGISDDKFRGQAEQI